MRCDVVSANLVQFNLFLANSDTPPSHERFPDKKEQKLQIGESGGEGRSVATRAVCKSQTMIGPLFSILFACSCG